MLAMGNAEQVELQATGNGRTVGVVIAERLYAGVLQDGQLVGGMQTFPEGDRPVEADDDDSLVELHTDALVEAVCDATLRAAGEDRGSVTAVGVALPGLIRGGVVEEAPNLPQLKGARIAEMLSHGLGARGLTAPVIIVNDADAIAAGFASASGKLHSHIRVWTLGTGIGFGSYPFSEGVWEGGHTVVTLDEKENYCGCGGKGHLEGIMGHRAMRLRFLDMEPEEVFENACGRNPDSRCAEFRSLWHRALAAATASSIHISGAGRFYLTGYNIRFLDLNLLRQYLHEMVKMSPLQSYQLEILPEDQTHRVIGAAVMAEQAAHHR